MKRHGGVPGRLLAAVVLSACSAWGGVAKEGLGGRLALMRSGLSFAPSVFLPGWKGVASNGGGEKGVASTFGFNLGKVQAAGRASFVGLPDGRVSARWFLTVDGAVRVEQLYLSVRDIPEEIRTGGAYVVDGVERPFPAVGAAFQFGQKKDAREVAFKDRAGRVRATVRFDAPTAVVFQDNDRFGGGVELRLVAAERDLVPGRFVAWGLTVGEDEPLTLREWAPCVIAPGERWRPLSVKGGIVPGSALDFSALGGVDAPAGKHGRVVVRNGHFEFEGAPGVPRRFYGVNLCFGANYPQTPETAERFAAELARRGYNAVRLHHHDGGLVAKGGDSTTLDPVRMRELDALVAAFVKRGVYVTTDLYVSRAVPWRDVGVDRPGNVEMNEFKTLVRESEPAFSNLCAFARNWLTHVNAFTGRRWADEPGVAWISLVNENCPDNFVHGLDDAGRARHVALENRFYARMARFLRETVGAQQLLTDLNGWSTSETWRACRQAFDYVDMHFYVDHPRFLERRWRLPSACANRLPFAGSAPDGVSGAGRCRVPGKPFTITEWNFAAPGRYRGVGGIVTGAWAAREDWDGLWRFAWSHSAEGVRNPCAQAVNYFDMSGDPLSLAGERASLCLFLRGDLAPGDRSALAFDARAGTMTIRTARTAGGFALRGRIAAGAFEADVGDDPATVWASALDAQPLERSRRILVTHLTDVQNTGARFEDDDMKVLLAWGRRPHLMRAGRAEVSLAVEEGGRFRAYVLDVDGARRGEIPVAVRGGRLVLAADVARDPDQASFLYEIVRDGPAGDLR